MADKDDDLEEISEDYRKEAIPGNPVFEKKKKEAETPYEEALSDVEPAAYAEKRAHVPEPKKENPVSSFYEATKSRIANFQESQLQKREMRAKDREEKLRREQGIMNTERKVFGYEQEQRKFKKERTRAFVEKVADMFNPLGLEPSRVPPQQRASRVSYITGRGGYAATRNQQHPLLDNSGPSRLLFGNNDSNASRLLFGGKGREESNAHRLLFGNGKTGMQQSNASALLFGREKSGREPSMIARLAGFREGLRKAPHRGGGKTITIRVGRR